VSEEKHK